MEQKNAIAAWLPQERGRAGNGNAAREMHPVADYSTGDYESSPRDGCGFLAGSREFFDGTIRLQAGL
jgi:hypothetical protein